VPDVAGRGRSWRQIGRARLRKHVVTEDVQITVTIRREELRLEREPVPSHAQSLVTDPDVFGTDEVPGQPPATVD
jgi:stress response protein YsnF